MRARSPARLEFAHAPPSPRRDPAGVGGVRGVCLSSSGVGDAHADSGAAGLHAGYEGRVFERVGCTSACLGEPARIVDVCIHDDMDDVIAPFWLMQKVTVGKRAPNEPALLQSDVAFGPLDPPESSP